MISCNRTVRTLFVPIFCMLSGTFTHATSMGEPNGSDAVSFSGTLTSREGKTLTIMNVRIGTDRDSARIKDITMYELPQDRPAIVETKTGAKKEIPLNINPKEGLMTLSVNLEQIKKIEVPEPDTVWTHKDAKRNIATEHVELTIWHKDDQSNKALMPLGAVGSPRPTKIFLDSVPGCQKGKKGRKECLSHLETFCPAIPSEDRVKRSVPFTAIKSLEIHGYCHHLPAGAEYGTMHKDSVAKKRKRGDDDNGREGAAKKARVEDDSIF